MSKRIIINESQYGLAVYSELLLEKWSRSDDIDKFIEDVYDAITKTIPSSEKTKLDDGIDLYCGNCSCRFLDEEINIEYYIYNTSDNEKAHFAITNLERMNGYDFSTNEMILTLYLVNGVPFEPTTTRNIAHEAEHLLQITYAKRNNKNYVKLNGDEYEYASEIIHGDIPSNETQKKIAMLFYYCNPHEQDSFINEYYEALKFRKQFMEDKDSDIHRLLFSMKHLYEWCKANLNNEEFSEAIDKYAVFGYSKKTFMVMVEKGIKRFGKKMRNIEKHFKERVKQLNESGIHYMPKDIGPLRRFPTDRTTTKTYKNGTKNEQRDF